MAGDVSASLPPAKGAAPLSEAPEEAAGPSDAGSINAMIVGPVR